MIFYFFVRYKHETLCIKYAKPNQTSWFVRYNRVFAITVIVITEFDCTFTLNVERKFYLLENIFLKPWITALSPRKHPQKLLSGIDQSVSKYFFFKIVKIPWQDLIDS